MDGLVAPVADALRSEAVWSGAATGAVSGFASGLVFFWNLQAANLPIRLRGIELAA